MSGLTFTRQGREHPSLSGVTAALEAPMGVGLVGAAGAGKSTLLKVLAGFVPGLVPGRLEGELRLGSRPLSEYRAAERTRLISLVFSDPARQLSGACPTVRDELAWGLENLAVEPAHIRDRVEQVLTMTGLTHLAERSPLALSGGQQQRVAMASVLALQPGILLLDEPVSALDPGGVAEVTALARQLVAEGTAVIWATPRLAEVAWCEHWWVLEGGRLTVCAQPSVETAAGALAAPWTRLARAAGWKKALPISQDQALEGFRQRAHRP